MRAKQIRVKLADRWAQLTPQQAMDAAVALHQAGQREAARQIYRTVLRYSPSSSQELQSLGAACYNFGDYAEALRHYQKIAAKEPRNAAVRSDIGVALYRLGRFQEASEAYAESLKLDPDNAQTLFNYGGVLTDLHRYDEALAHCQRAVQIDPGCAEALNNLGRVLDRLGLPEQAGESCRLALAADANLAEAHQNYAHELLRQGDFAHGLEEFEWRWKCKGFPSGDRHFRQPQWDGPDLGGKTILLHAEQGLGDSLQFVRYAPLVAARHGRVLLEVQPELASLLAGLAGVAGVIARGDALPHFDTHCPLLSLPRALATRLETIPAAVPYLAPDPELVKAWSHLRQTGRLSVGLVWAGSPTHAKDQQRTLPLHRFQALAGLQGVAWFSLQKGPAAAQLLHPPPGMRIEDLGPGLNSFADTAAALANLDLVISVDTAVVHLAGALGHPVWTLLPYTPDWRWLMDREDSPWYPSLRLFRQVRLDDWDHVLERVRVSLAALLTGASRPAETARRMGVIRRRETDVARWSDPGELAGNWEPRASAAADFIPSGAGVLDLGCGAMSLERVLPPQCRYLPCDIVRRDERTVLCDFNTLELPPKGDATIVTLLGVLEYIYDWKAFLGRLHEYGLPVVMSYCPADLTGQTGRAALGWVNHLGREELTAALAEAGFSIRASAMLGAHQMLLRLSAEPAPARLSRKVLVLSYANIGNFGDRLGFHLLNSILPPQAEVTWAPIHPAPVPTGGFDLGIIGIGNSLFQPLLSEDLLAVVEQLPASVGIFGTQYRESIDPARLDRLLDRLTVWLARYEEDVLLYGKGRKSVVHMGDWLVGQFPMTNWTVDGRLTVDRWVLQDLPLDRTIQKIQQYREVVSERVHPLLCALTSAERVAYREQRENGAARGGSGKFRSLLLDVFGRTFPEETFFQVDRDAVAGYRARVQACLGELPGLLGELLQRQPR